MRRFLPPTFVSVATVSFVAVCAVTACAEGDVGSAAEADADAADLEVSLDNAGDYPVVTSEGTPVRWRLTEERVIGSADVDSLAPDAFGQVVDVDVDPLGRLWVLDGETDDLRVFGADGSHVRTIGGPGQGPGEFAGAQSFTILDSLVRVWDVENARIVTLDTAGSWRGSYRYASEATGTPSRVRMYAPSPSYRAVQTWRTVGDEVIPGFATVTQDSVLPGWDQPARPDVSPDGMTCEVSGGDRGFEAPWAATTVRLPAGAGETWIGGSDGYRLARVGAEGDTLLLLRRPRVAPALSDDEWDEGLARFREFRRANPLADCTPAGALERPVTKGAFARVWESPAGQLWVEVYTETGTEWEVFGTDGALLAAVDGFEYDAEVVPHFGSSHAAWVVEDSLGVQRVHVARIER